MPNWALFARTPDHVSNGGLPIISVLATTRHMGVSAAVVETPFTPEAWGRLAPSCGVILTRDGFVEFAGDLTERELVWDRKNGRAIIKVSCTGDEQDLADRPVFPDPLRAPDDQTVNDYWRFTGQASAAMLRLISDQAGPTCRPDRAITGLQIGPDPGVGPTLSFQELFTNTLETLSRMSVVSGANLGVRVTQTAGVPVAGLYAPRDLTAKVRFSADLSNLIGFRYIERAPTVTDALSNGQGDLRLRLRRYLMTTDPLALRWGRRIWAYIDRRDTADPADLDKANTDALAEGEATVSLTVELTDSQAATYRTDWLLGDKITVYVGLPGQVKVATVADVVREIRFQVAETGAETIRPAIGTDDAKAVIPTPSVEQLAAVGRQLTALITRK